MREYSPKIDTTEKTSQRHHYLALQNGRKGGELRELGKGENRRV